MTRTELEEALDRAEAALKQRRNLKGTGFWKAVDAVRRDRSLGDTYADRIAAIDRRAFEQGVKMRVPVTIGVAVLAVATVLGAFLIVQIVRADLGVPLRLGSPNKVLDLDWPGAIPIAFLAGFGLILIGTHSLAHFVVGRLLGIRFTHVFLGGPPPPRPGVKTDYASYLRATSTQRAVMHASGAVVTKLVPFVFLRVSLHFYDAYPWMTWLLIAVGVGQIITDVTLSTKVSDWKKVKRELKKA